METIATIGGVQLLKKDDDYFISELVENNHFLLEFKEDKNAAHLVFVDYLGQVMSGKEAFLNLNLREIK